MSKHAATAALVLMTALPLPAMAEVASPWNEHPNAKVRLIAGEGRMLGVELVLAPGWKTYWRMPGDAGVPPSFDWAGSNNIKSAEVLYPAPQTIPDQGGIAVGYKGAVTFPVQLTLDTDGKAAQAVLEFAFGVCREICIPVESKLRLDLPGDKVWGPSSVLKTHLARVPRVADEVSKAAPLITSIMQAGDGEKAIVKVATVGALDVYVEAPDGLFVPLTERKAGGLFELNLAKSSDAKDLIGKALRVTAVTATGGVETRYVVK